MSAETVEEIFDGFWRDIVMPKGAWDLDQVKRELADYEMILRAVAEVYCDITQGRISKPNSAAAAVLAVHEDVCKPHDYDAAVAVCEAIDEHLSHGGALPWPLMRRAFEAWAARR